jgi:PAS domain S-box-containing protein
MKSSLKKTKKTLAKLNEPDDTLSDPALLAGLQRDLLDNAGPICICDRRGILVYTNAAFQRIVDEVKPGDRAPLRRDGEEIALVIGERVERYTLHAKSVPGPDGLPALFASVFEPHGEHEWASQALDVALERLEDFTRLVTDWIWETNRNLVLTYVSPRVNEVLGYHSVELTGRALQDLPSKPNKTLMQLSEPDHRKPFRDLEVTIAGRDGKTRHVQLSGLPVYSRDSGDFLGYRGTAHDVTEIRWRETVTRKAKEDAELASRAKSEFLANMSHELRTPLNAIIGFSEIMGGEMLGPLGTGQYKGYVHDIADSARHLLALINDILDAAKIESGQMSLSESEINPTALAESVIRLMMPRAQRAGLKLNLHAGEGLPKLLADETKLKQILINLVSNAVKFTPAGGRVDVRAELDASGDFVFMVCDTGIGIAKDDIPHALAPFGQVESRFHPSFEGTGLGLPLAKSMTEMHGGRFELVSQPNLGTTVILRLPQSRVLRA